MSSPLDDVTINEVVTLEVEVHITSLGTESTASVDDFIAGTNKYIEEWLTSFRGRQTGSGLGFGIRNYSFEFNYGETAYALAFAKLMTASMSLRFSLPQDQIRWSIDEVRTTSFNQHSTKEW